MSVEDDRTHIGEKLRTLQHCALYRRTINCTCPRCRHIRRFDAVALWWLYARKGWDDRVFVIKGRLYCAACQKKGYGRVIPQIEITRDRPDAEQPPYPDEREWKRIVSRYRS